MSDELTKTLRAMSDYSSRVIADELNARGLGHWSSVTVLRALRGLGLRTDRRPLIWYNRKQEGASAFAESLRPLLESSEFDALTLRQMAAELNRRGVPTAAGGQRGWSASLVLRVLNRLGPLPAHAREAHGTELPPQTRKWISEVQEEVVRARLSKRAAKTKPTA
jgi:hypothetical protein